jgi:AraC-like DNA-binding protein
MKLADLIGLRFGLHAGIPVQKSDSIFGTTIRLAHFLCTIGRDNQLTMSSVARGLYRDNDWNVRAKEHEIRWLTSAEEHFLENLLDTLENHWVDPEFDIGDFCHLMSVSKPQLYRKSMATTGMSPNALLREYRLLKSLTMLRDEGRNISQTTFDTGFSSPSYFTKCFQKRFGIPPMAYQRIRG